jgi:hypothetical protein
MTGIPAATSTFRWCGAFAARLPDGFAAFLRHEPG